MDIRQAALVALAGVALFIYLAFIGQFVASIAVMIVLIIGMTVFMTRLSKKFGDIPELTAKLSPDAKSVIIRNLGNTSAMQVHVALVPLDIEYDIAEVPAEEEHTYPLDNMVSEAKAFITWKDTGGQDFSHESAISALGKGDDDLLKPMFPMFDIKK
jgi:hypothetical protein